MLAPTHADLFGADAVITILQVQQFTFKSTDYGAAHCDGLALVHASRWLHAENLSCHCLDAGDS